MPRIKSPLSKNNPRQPVQTRGIQTRENILNAGERLFMRSGFHAVLADDVAREAGVSVGSFYSYFKDKRALFLAILQRDSDATLERAAAFFSSLYTGPDTNIEDLVRQTILLLIESHRGFFPMHQEAQQMAVFDVDFKAYLDGSDRAVQQIFVRLLQHINPRLDASHLPEMAYVLYHASEGIIHHLVAHPAEAIDRERIVTQSAKLFTAYILCV